MHTCHNAQIHQVCGSCHFTQIAVLAYPLPAMASGRTWVFTVNNYAEEDINWVMNLECVKVCCAKEVGESGTPHLQGAVTFKRMYRLAGLKKLNTKAHWEKALATQDFNYCKKAGSEVIRDENNIKQGKRTDIEEIRDCLEAGDDIQQVHKKARSMQAVQFAKSWFNVMGNHLPKNTKITVHWYYGCSGTGKTKKVLEQCDPFIPLNFKWWEGYEGQDAVLLDDLRPDWCKPAELLRLIDPYRYNYRVEIKGGSRPLVATKIYITTPWHPEDFWREIKEDPQQLVRRIDYLVHFRSDGEWIKPSGG